VAGPGCSAADRGPNGGQRLGRPRHMALDHMHARRWRITANFRPRTAPERPMRRPNQKPFRQQLDKCASSCLRRAAEWQFRLDDAVTQSTTFVNLRWMLAAASFSECTRANGKPRARRARSLHLYSTLSSEASHGAMSEGLEELLRSSVRQEIDELRRFVDRRIAELSM
jgi:hypothetical protein